MKFSKVIFFFKKIHDINRQYIFVARIFGENEGEREKKKETWKIKNAFFAH